MTDIVFASASNMIFSRSIPGIATSMLYASSFSAMLTGCGNVLNSRERLIICCTSVSLNNGTYAPGYVKLSALSFICLFMMVVFRFSIKRVGVNLQPCQMYLDDHDLTVL